MPDFAVNEDGGQHRSAACPLALGCAGQDAGRARAPVDPPKVRVPPAPSRRN
ncbi:hypothetical protein GGQ68_002101 [Sagittula marina]|uniref:Uncharacterized protein n=1 Tax=Sagittula marina TaxID=943940 RepID=A0A7W6DTG3_9RHOB|nr:hypothetical protein [Sagittula marina]